MGLVWCLLGLDFCLGLSFVCLIGCCLLIWVTLGLFRGVWVCSKEVLL